MKEEEKANPATQSPALTAHVKQEKISEVMQAQQHGNSLQPRTGMTPSRHNNFFPWTPFPLGQAVVPEAAVVTYSERRLNSLEWAELLDQTECLEYVSPDIDECIEQQSRMEGNQELELTGREFVDSPAIPILPPLNTLPSANPPTLSKPVMGPQHNVSRRPGLREQFPRHQSVMEHNRAHFPDNYPVAEQPVEMKRPTKRCSSASKRNADDPTSRSTSRSLKFEPPQQLKSHTRRKRASWSGRSARATSTPGRRQCKSARKSKDCMIPGCTKGARSRGLCKRHGGGKRCTHTGCARSDQGGGFCIAHGGGKRCSSEGCKNSAQSRGLCKSHGGIEVERGAVQKAAPKAAKPEVSAVAIDRKRSWYRSKHHFLRTERRKWPSVS